VHADDERDTLGARRGVVRLVVVVHRVYFTR
jgi:hypothetical protein